MTEKSDHAEPIIESTQVKMTAGNESEERDESEKTESEGVEEVDVEDVELLINIKNKAKSKKRKAPTSIQKQQSCEEDKNKVYPISRGDSDIYTTNCGRRILNKGNKEISECRACG